MAKRKTAIRKKAAPRKKASPREKCRYERTPGKPCGRAALRNGLCLAHCEDRTPTEDKRFEKQLARQLDKGDCDFAGYVFHERFRFREGYDGFNEYVFPENTAVCLAHAQFRSDASFTEVTIDGDADFSNARIRGHVLFSEARVSGNANFRDAAIRGDVRFARASIRGHALFRDAAVTGAVRSQLAVIDGDANLRGTRVGRYVDFRAAAIGGYADFRNTTTGDDVTFIDTQFAGDALFWGAAIGARAHFRRARFGGRARFEGATAASIVRFDGAHFQPGDGAGAYRFARKANQNAGDYLRAGDCFFDERRHDWAARYPALAENYEKVALWLRAKFKELGEAARARLRRLSGSQSRPSHAPARGEGAEERADGSLSGVARFLGKARVSAKNTVRVAGGLLELVFARWIYGYGERPMRIVAWALAAILGFSFIYCLSGGIAHAQSAAPLTRWADALYYSTTCFITLGARDWRPTPGHWVSLMVALEAFIGVLMMVLFAVTLAKRYSRG